MRRYVVPDPRLAVKCFISCLEQIVRRERHDVLLAGIDASLFAISHYRERLEGYVRLGLPSHDVVEQVFDRARVADAAAQAGLASPDSRLCTGTREALDVAGRFGYPVLVKPRLTVMEDDGAIRRWASIVADDPDELGAAARSFGSCIVQRRVGGTVISVGGVAAGRQALYWVVSRYKRTWPAGGGSVSFSETIQPPVTLMERVDALIAELQWSGVFELELIAREDGELSAIDFNPRPYGSLGLAVAAGVPLPVLWCERVLGEPRASPTTGRPGVRYRWGDADIRHVVRHLANGQIRRAVSVATPRRKVAHAYFQLRDPVPAIARTVDQITRWPGARRRDPWATTSGQQVRRYDV